MSQPYGPWLPGMQPAGFDPGGIANLNGLAAQGPQIQTGYVPPVAEQPGWWARNFGGPNGVGVGNTVAPNTPPQAVGLGANMGTLQLGIGGVQAGMNIWNSMQAQDLAKKTFAFNRDIANTNLNNSIRSYNTALEDRAASREAYTSGRFDDSYVERNRARRG
jgi:hypothetical protein